MIKKSNVTVAANLFNTAFGGIFGSRVLPVLVGSSSFGFVGVIFYSGSRVVLEAARKGYLPFDRFFSKVHPKLQTPINTLVLLYLISLIFLLAPPPGSVFQFIVAFSGYGGYFFAALSVIGLQILRRTQPDIKRPIRVPLVVSIVFVLICLYTLVFVFIPPVTKPAGYPYFCKSRLCITNNSTSVDINALLFFIIVPYIITMVVALFSVVLWYFKLVVKDSLATSYNAEIRLDGQQELFEDVYKDYASSVSKDTQSIDDDHKSIHHAEVHYNPK